MKLYKFIVAGIVLSIIILVFSIQAQAALQVLGTDSLGNQLIYDTDLDITWYDYTRTADLWSNQINWASGLSVNFGGSILNGWRLPTTTQPDSSCDTQYDPGGGLPIESYGYNCAGSELGHLYYTELGNSASGTLDTGDFQHLQPTNYWSETDGPLTNSAWFFNTFDGRQHYGTKDGYRSAIAVRNGLAVVPEPISSVLFIVGGATLGFSRLRKRFIK